MIAERSEARHLPVTSPEITTNDRSMIAPAADQAPHSGSRTEFRVQTPSEAARVAAADAEAAMAAIQAAGDASPPPSARSAHAAPALRLVGVEVLEVNPDMEATPMDEPAADDLWAAYKRGELEPEEVEFPASPGMTRGERGVLADIGLLLGLRLADGISGPLPYASGYAAARAAAGEAPGAPPRKGSAHRILRQLDEGRRVIRCVGEMPRMGYGRGTKLYVSRSWLPVDLEMRRLVREAGDRGESVSLPNAAETVWAPASELEDGTA